MMTPTHADDQTAPHSGVSPDPTDPKITASQVPHITTGNFTRDQPKNAWEDPSTLTTTTPTESPSDQVGNAPAGGTSCTKSQLNPTHCGPIEYRSILNDMWPTTDEQAWTPGHTYKILYDQIRNHALPNYMGAKITVPSSLKLESWEARLQDYHDKELCLYLRYGWPSSFTGSRAPRATLTNHLSGAKYPHHVENFIQKEISLGGMIGPFSSPPFQPWTQVSPLLTRPKKDSGERRVIVDLSYPEGWGVNAGILPRFFQGEQRDYTLPTIGDLLTKVQLEGRGCYLWKADLSRAYRQLRLDPLDLPLLGIHHNGQYYLDVCPSFGARFSGSACQRTTNAVVYMMSQRGHHALAYVDDFCGANRDFRGACDAYAAFEGLTADLGLSLAPDKCAFPSTQMEWLGFSVDTQAMTVTIPKEKMEELATECNKWAHTGRASKKEIQSLVGKLIHISKCVTPGRKFIARILSVLSGMQEGSYAWITPAFRADVRWFEAYAGEANGVSLIDPNYEEFEIECDSCLQGGGGHSTTAFYSLPYTDHHKECFTHITQLEAVNLLVAYRTLASAAPGGFRVVIKTDNLSSKHALTTGRTKDPVLAACARELWLEAAKNNHDIDIRHKPGIELVLADALSRRHISRDMDTLATRLTNERELSELSPSTTDSTFTHNL